MFCPKCGKELKESVIFCDECKKVLKIPLGLNIVGIFLIILAILGILYSIIFLWAINIPEILEEILKTKVLESWTKEIFTKFGFILGVSLLFFSVFYLIIGMGLRKLKRWAGILGIIFSILGLVLGYRSIISIIINLSILILILTNYRYLNGLARDNP